MKSGSEGRAELKDRLANLNDITVVQSDGIYTSITTIDASPTCRQAVLDEIAAFTIEQHCMFA